ncbi:DUF2513 domain-containing protein [Pseudomonas lurida]|jgi:hypothetical protein|uniref:DUF2513 domain-containing protein n=1 Tax=Pseudomonas lurida TaxID=244566 RepID=UPI001647C0F7|nr:DUF2513 domain-containing protein [Pseudomonas lurida]MBC3233732.1 DUF2513 domain-containing protein [Pseudomonas lurida]
MRRDMDLLRLLLLKLEVLHEDAHSICHYQYEELMVEGFTEDQVAYHLDLATEAGLVDQGGNGSMHGFMFKRLTWEGHDFVDAVRDNDIWMKTRQGVNAAGGFSVDLLKDLAKGFIKKKISEHTGVEI